MYKFVSQKIQCEFCTKVQFPYCNTTIKTFRLVIQYEKFCTEAKLFQASLSLYHFFGTPLIRLGVGSYIALWFNSFKEFLSV